MALPHYGGYSNQSKKNNILKSYNFEYNTQDCEWTNDTNLRVTQLYDTITLFRGYDRLGHLHSDR